MLFNIAVMGKILCREKTFSNKQLKGKATASHDGFVNAVQNCLSQRFSQKSEVVACSLYRMLQLFDLAYSEKNVITGTVIHFFLYLFCWVWYVSVTQFFVEYSWCWNSFSVLVHFLWMTNTKLNVDQFDIHKYHICSNNYCLLFDF